MAKTKAPRKSNAGRPSKIEELKKRDKEFRRLMELRPKREWVCAHFGVDEKTIHTFCKEFYGMSFSLFRDRCLNPIREKLINKAIDMSMAGSENMLKFCLKNQCGWTDNVTVSGELEVDHSLSFVDGDDDDEDDE